MRQQLRPLHGQLFPLLVYSGFLFDLPRGRLGFDPLRALGERFRCLWSVDAAWGTVDITDNRLELNVEEGALSLLRLRCPGCPPPPRRVSGRTAPSLPPRRGTTSSWRAAACRREPA